MTKKDYIAIARIIKGMTGFKLIDRPGLVKNLSEYFASQNPRFDPEKFAKACQ